LNEIEIFEECVKKWGLDAQLLMLAEESGELVQATLHMFRRAKQENALEHLKEEMADVKLMINQIQYFLKLEGDVNKIYYQKMEKLKKRLEI